MEAQNLNNSQNTQPAPAAPVNPVQPEPELQVSLADRLAMNIDQPIGIGTFVLKNVVQGSTTAVCTLAALRLSDWLKERKERKTNAVEGQNHLRVAGE